MSDAAAGITTPLSATAIDHEGGDVGSPGFAPGTSAVGTPGDYNNDGKVAAADYVVWRALLGVVLPGAVIMAVTLVAAIWTNLQGILLTALALGFFITAMLLIPRLRAAAVSAPAPAQDLPPVPG